MTNTEIPIMPLTIKEKLGFLKYKDSILINSTERRSWATKISELHSALKGRHYSIRTDPFNGEIRVWRLK